MTTRTWRSPSPWRSGRQEADGGDLPPPFNLSTFQHPRNNHGQEDSQVHAYRVSRRLSERHRRARSLQRLPSLRGGGIRRRRAVVRGGRRRALPELLFLLPGGRVRRDGRLPQGRARGRPPDALARRERGGPREPAERHDQAARADVQEARHELHPQLRRAQRREQPQVVRPVHPRRGPQARGRRDDDGPAARHRQQGHAHARVLPRPPEDDHGRRHPVRPRGVQGRVRHLHAHHGVQHDEALPPAARQGRAHPVPLARDGRQRRRLLPRGPARRRGRPRPLDGPDERRHLPARHHHDVALPRRRSPIPTSASTSTSTRSRRPRTPSRTRCRSTSSRRRR